MKASSSLLLFLTVSGFLSGCVSSPQPDSQNDRKTARLSDPQSIQPELFILRGTTVLGKESRSFTPCGSQQQYWLKLTPQQVAKASQINKRPNQPMYAEVIGYLRPSAATGLAADYNAIFVVDQINYLSAENNAQCNASYKPTRIFGNEPNWSAYFTADQLIYAPMGGEKQAFTIEKHQLTNLKRHYQWQNGQLTLTRTLCEDTMSDQLYGWTAQLSLEQKTLTGCATTANTDTTASWVGRYGAQSTESNGFSITLALKSDHTAVTQYQYDNGDPTLTERGFWQQLNANQIQVVMMQHQGMRLVSERIFTLNHHGLHTNNEKVSGRIYPIVDGGLTLFPLTKPEHISSDN